jgi:hypothetical protein
MNSWETHHLIVKVRKGKVFQIKKTASVCARALALLELPDNS